MSNLAKRPLFENMAISAEKAFVAVADKDTWMKEIGFALQILRANADAFSKCDPNTIKDAVVNVALTGATLNPVSKQAYLIPRAIKGKLSCCLDFSYRGLVKIATDNSSSVFDIDASCVYKNDEFYYEQGLQPVLRHIPTDGERGEIRGAYAIATLHHGIKKPLYMRWDEIEKTRNSSQCPNSPAWTNWPEEMSKKTVVKRLCKLLPRSERLDVAIAALNKHEGLAEQPKNAAKEVMDRFCDEDNYSEETSIKDATPKSKVASEDVKFKSVDKDGNKFFAKKNKYPGVFCKKEGGEFVWYLKAGFECPESLKKFLPDVVESDVQTNTDTINSEPTITNDQALELNAKIGPNETLYGVILDTFDVDTLKKIPASKFQDAMDMASKT